MRDNVEASWRAYNDDLEGVFPHMYLDIRCLVTAAVGILCDPIERAYALPWVMPNGVPANKNQIIRDWSALKDRGKDVARLRADKQAALTVVRLKTETIDLIVIKQLRANVAYLRKFLPNWDTIPSDAQLGILSGCWAYGAGINKTHPKLVEAILAEDWLQAEIEAAVDTHNNAGVVARNTKQAICFENATLVKARGEPPHLLHWPNSAKRSVDEEIRREALAATDPVLASGLPRNS